MFFRESRASNFVCLEFSFLFDINIKKCSIKLYTDVHPIAEILLQNIADLIPLAEFDIAKLKAQMDIAIQIPKNILFSFSLLFIRIISIPQ